MQVPEGRLDIKAASMDKPYEIVTPRGTVALEQQGDYYIQAGSTQDPTRLGVRSGAAQITGLNGQTLAVRAGEIGEVTGEFGRPRAAHDPGRAAADATLLGRSRSPGVLRPAAISVGIGHRLRRSRRLWCLEQPGRLWPGMDAELGAGRLGALSHGSLDLCPAVGLDLGRRAALGLRAVPLWSLGKRQ